MEVYAEAALVRAVQLRPDMTAGWINLALLGRDRHRPCETENHLRKALALNSEETATYIAWAQFRTGEGDSAGGWGWLRWALAREPNNDEAHNMCRSEEHTSELQSP